MAAANEFPAAWRADKCLYLFLAGAPCRFRLSEDFFGIVGHHEPYVSELTLAEIELTPDENLRSRMQARCADLPVLSGKERPPAEDAQYSRPGECGAEPPEG